MKEPTLTVKELRLIEELVAHYRVKKLELEGFGKVLRDQIRRSPDLKRYLHSVRFRMKAESHLRDKLQRKFKEIKKKHRKITYSTKNLFTKVNDLAGLRIIHIHTLQVKDIDAGLKKLFNEEKHRIVEGPAARTWDDESRELFRRLGIRTKKSPTLYTSVHYVVKPNRRTPVTCEIQARTLMEEVWGEVDHSINYPHPTENLACREQIAALARATSACSRLVDAIVRSHAHYENSQLNTKESSGKQKKD